MIAATATRRRGVTGIAVALATTLLVNGLLLVVLLLLDRSRPAPPPAPFPVRHLAILPPSAPPPVVGLPAKIPISHPAPAASRPPLPALPALALSSSVAATMLSLPALPLIDTVRPISMPAVAAAEGAASAPSPVPPGGVGSALVDEQPVLINGFDLERFYPRSARLRGVQGTSSMRLGINAEGTVVAISIIASDPPGVFDGAAQALCKTLRYTPARVQDRPVACVITLAVEWRLPR